MGTHSSKLSDDDYYMQASRGSSFSDKSKQSAVCQVNQHAQLHRRLASFQFRWPASASSSFSCGKDSEGQAGSQVVSRCPSTSAASTYNAGNLSMIDKLPSHILEAVAAHLDPASFAQARLTCRSWACSWGLTVSEVTHRVQPSAMLRSLASRRITGPDAAWAAPATPMCLAAAFPQCSTLVLDCREFSGVCGLVELNNDLAMWAGAPLRRLVIMAPPPQKFLPSLEQLQSLRTLEIVDAGLVDVDLLAGVAACTKLTSLTLSGTVAHSVTPLCFAGNLAPLKHLRTLNVASRPSAPLSVTPPMLRLLASVFPRLQSLHLVGRCRGGRQALECALNSMSTVQHAVLEDNTGLPADPDPTPVSALAPTPGLHRILQRAAAPATAPHPVALAPTPRLQNMLHQASLVVGITA